MKRFIRRASRPTAQNRVYRATRAVLLGRELPEAGSRDGAYFLPAEAVTLTISESDRHLIGVALRAAGNAPASLLRQLGAQ